MKRDLPQVTRRATVLYGLGATLWMMLGDRWLARLNAGSTLLVALQTLKTLAFLGATSLWFYLAWRAKQSHDRREAAARHAVEQQLRDSEERLRLAIETAPMGTWDLNLLTGQIYWSANLWALFGLTPVADLHFETFCNTLHPEDRERVRLAVDDAIKTRAPYHIEFRVVHPDGRIRWSLSNGRCLTDAQGRPVRLIGVDLDITERKEAEAAQHADAQRFRTLCGAINDAVWDCDMSTRQLNWSVGLTTQFGYAIGPETADPRWWSARIHPDDRGRMLAMLASALDGGNASWATDYRFRRADGSYADVLSRGQLLRDDAGRPLWMMGALMDITSRKRMEAALRESEERLQLALTASRMGVWEWDIKTNRVFWSKECFAILGAADFDGTFDGFARLLHPDDTTRFVDQLQLALNHQTRFDFGLEFRIRRPDGTVRWLANSGRAEYDAAGTPVRMIGTVMDIHPRKQSELALEHQRRRMEGIVNSAMDGIITINEDHCIEVFNTVAEEMFGYAAGEVLGQSLVQLLPLPVADRYCEHIRRFGQTSTRTVSRLGTIRGRRKNGDEFPIAATISQIQLDGHKLYTVTCRDVTESIEAQTLIRDSQERFGLLAGYIREVFWVKEVSSQHLHYMSPAYEEIWGRTCESLYRSPGDWLDSIHPDDRSVVTEAVQTKQATGTYDETFRILRPDGTIRWIHSRAFPVREADGSVLRIAGIAEDITARRLLEEQLLQSQKLEAIGLLAGGVAHDFNNLLTVIKGNATLMLMPNASRELTTESAQEIVKAAERAASLTRQLLLFSRKQALQVTAVHLNETVADMLRLLQRILGEHVVLTATYAPDLPLISADVAMLEQVLLNLAVNARDAMPQGGRLMLTTAVETLDSRQAQQTPEAAPGTYVCLTVTDTGSGIAKEHLAHIFEPFFTTKEVGKGTGLGLATVYGIVKQHRGRIAVCSEVARGTTFRICFPALSTSTSAPAVSTSVPERPPETILVVEEEPTVRRLTASLLTQAGYRVLAAASAAEALALWRAHAPSIHLLLTDLRMPDGLTGRELAAQLTRERPGLKIIYTSGSGANPEEEATALGDAADFLQKPYQPKRLVGLVRECLERS